MCSTQRHRYQIEQIVLADNEALSHHFVPGSSYLTLSCKYPLKRKCITDILI